MKKNDKKEIKKDDNLKNQSNLLLTVIGCMAVLLVAVITTVSLNMRGSYAAGGYCAGVGAATAEDCAAEGGVWVPNNDSGGGSGSEPSSTPPASTPSAPTCGANAYFTGTVCRCSSGYTGDGYTCTKESTTPTTPTCGEHAHVNVSGTTCVCDSGYTGDGQTCTKVATTSTCATNGGGSKSACTSAATAACPNGYTGCNGGDENGCYTYTCNSGSTTPTTPTCGEHAHVNVSGTTCVCDSGYTGDGQTCTKVATTSTCATNGGPTKSGCTSAATAACPNGYTGCNGGDENGCYTYTCKSAPETSTCDKGGSQSECEAALSAAGSSAYPCEADCVADSNGCYRIVARTCSTKDLQKICKYNNWYWFQGQCYSVLNENVCEDSLGKYWYNGKCNENPYDVSQCTFGTPQQNSAGGLFAEVNCPNGGTSDDKEAACNSRGWDYRGGKCYMKGTLKIGSEEYNWITPLDDGVCPDGWFYNATLKSCLDRICDCDEGDCGNPEISVCSGNTVTQYSCMQEARAKCSNGYVGCEKDSNGCYTYTCNSPTPGTSTPGTDPTPTNKCYYCWISSTSGVYTVATSEKEALTIVKRSHSSATSCQLEVDSTKCAGAPPTSTSTSTGTISCYRCKVSSSGYMYTKAKTPDEAATITKGIDCVTVAESMCKVPSSTSTSTSTPVVNPPTGGTAIIIAWIIGIFAIVYSVWYFSKNSELEKK